MNCRPRARILITTDDILKIGGVDQKILCLGLFVDP